MVRDWRCSSRSLSHFNLPRKNCGLRPARGQDERAQSLLHDGAFGFDAVAQLEAVDIGITLQ